MSELKYKYAYDQDNNIVHIDSAFKNKYGQMFYLMPNKQCELILADGIKNQKHFRIKQGATIGGNVVSSGSMGESVAHHNAKMQIVKDGFFDWSIYRIYIKNPKYEYRLDGSRYRADLFAELHCGTPCAIEIILSSGVSESKRNFIKENKILTFELYYDKTGVQNLKQFDCYGNEQIEDVKRRILEGESRVEGLRRTMPKEKSRIRNEYDSKSEIFNITEWEQFDIENSYIERRTREIENSIEAIRGEIKSIAIDKGIDFREVDEFTEAVKSNISRIREAKREIEKCAEIYRRLKSEEDKINGLEISVNRLEESFRKASEDCRAEWFGNPPSGMSDYQFIKYMTE
jgi:predicted  nucleic acid-binding Zn-ribbon protein